METRGQQTVQILVEPYIRSLIAAGILLIIFVMSQVVLITIINPLA
jgi:hypothetical protein